MNMDEQVSEAFAAWDKCHRALAENKANYEAALALHRAPARRRIPKT